jgi:hypothetical protein
MTRGRRRSDRSGRAPLFSPGRPTVAGREVHRQFWAAVGVMAGAAAAAASHTTRHRRTTRRRWWKLRIEGLVQTSVLQAQASFDFSGSEGFLVRRVTGGCGTCVALLG